MYIKKDVRETGDRGDCGNYAIALKRFLGKGELCGIFDGGEGGDDSNPILEHVMLNVENGLLDVHGFHPHEKIYENIYWMWGYFPLDIVVVTDDEIFEILSKTSLERVEELVAKFRENGINRDEYQNYLEKHRDGCGCGGT